MGEPEQHVAAEHRAGRRRVLPWVAALLSLVQPSIGLLVAGVPPSRALLLLLCQVAYLTSLAVGPLAPRVAGWSLVITTATIVLGIIPASAVIAYREARRLPRRTRRQRWALLASLALAASLVALLGGAIETARATRMEPFRICTTQSAPTLVPGDVILLDERPDVPLGRGDLVVVRWPREPSLNALLRVVGLPGETVAVEAHAVLVEGVVLAHLPCPPELAPWEPCFLEVPRGGRAYPITLWNSPRGGVGPTLVGDQELFLLADNRDTSTDSRDVGPIPDSLRRGRPVALIFPALDRHFFERIGRPLP